MPIPLATPRRAHLTPEAPLDPERSPLPAGGGEPASEFWRPSRRTAPPRELTGGRVLVVDDEVDVCAYVALALKRLGFQTSATTDPRQALDRLLVAPDDYRLLLTDQRMPGLTGIELITRVWSARPDFPVVLMSGYGWGIDPAALSGVGFLGKPFELPELERAVRVALFGASEGAERTEKR